MDDGREVREEFIRVDSQFRQYVLYEKIVKDGFDGKTVLIYAAHAKISSGDGSHFDAATLPRFHS
jgi:hypothetical protein